MRALVDTEAKVVPPQLAPASLNDVVRGTVELLRPEIENRGLRVEEIPGAYIRRFDKTSTVSGMRDSIRYFGKLVAFRKTLGAAPPR